MNKINLLIKLVTEDRICRQDINEIEELYLKQLVSENMVSCKNDMYNITEIGEIWLQNYLTRIR